MHTNESLLASWLPRHRVLHLSGRNVLLGLLCVLAGLGLLGWCLYWINNAHTSWRSNHRDETHYKLVAELLVPASLGLLGLGTGRLLRFRFLLGLTQLLFGLSAAGCFFAAVILLRLVVGTGLVDLSGVLLLPILVLLGGLCVVLIRKLQCWLRQTRQ